jgi:hypothetical protein
MSGTIFDHYLFRDFALPFLLIFTVVFAILEKTKVLGDGKTQINAIVSLVVGLIFISVNYPKSVVENMILFLTVAIIIMFVVLVLWGFAVGDVPKLLTGDKVNWVTWLVGSVIVLSVIIAVIWATGIKISFFSSLFEQSWSKSFWTNLIFLVVIAAAIAIAVKGGSSSGGKSKD